MVKEIIIDIPFYNEINEDWKKYKESLPYPFKDKLTEGMAFMWYAMGWFASAIRFRK